MTAPELLRQNSKLGHEVIRQRADLRRELKAGELRLSEILIEPALPSYLHTWNLEALLLVVPNMPRKTVELWLEEIPIKPTATVADPTYRKRRVLADKLKVWEERGEERSGKRALPQTAGGGSNRRFAARRQVPAQRVA